MRSLDGDSLDTNVGRNAEVFFLGFEPPPT
jgi:hypothetical protein